jgi:hypothetical protein
LAPGFNEEVKPDHRPWPSFAQGIKFKTVSKVSNFDAEAHISLPEKS